MQHDNHIWLVYNGESWAIRGMARSYNDVYFSLWRGYSPNIEYVDIIMIDPDWEGYCKEAAAMLQSPSRI